MDKPKRTREKVILIALGICLLIAALLLILPESFFSTLLILIAIIIALGLTIFLIFTQKKPK